MKQGAASGLWSPRAGLQWGRVTLLLAVVATVGWFGFRPDGWFVEGPEAIVRTAPVRRGPLLISVLEKGNLKAAEAVSLKSQIEGRASILSLIPEGTYVEEGDLVCELDVTELLDRQLSQAITVRNAEGAHIKALQNYEIQVSQNESDIAEAKQNEEFARQDVDKFTDTRAFSIAELDEAIKEAEEAFVQARNKLQWSEKLAENGFLTATELESDTISFNRAEIRLAQAAREKLLLTDYELPRQKAELAAALEEAQRELDRVELQAAARIVDFESDMLTKESKLDLEKEKLTKLEMQIAQAQIRAPCAGMVVYGRQEGGRHGNREPIAEGTEVRQRQEILSIPNAKGMLVEASVHESVLKQVRAGQECIVKVDSIPNQEFRGRVQTVALLPDQGSMWANPNLRVYRAEIAVEEVSPEMRPGMSCSVEILVDEAPDTLFVPVQAVFSHRGQTLCFVSGPSGTERREVDLGRFNRSWSEILDGLTEGELVLLSPPPDSGLVPDESGDPGKPATSSEDSASVQPHEKPAGN